MKEEPLNMTWANQYLGQRGLASKYLVSEIDPKVDPLSPANKLIITTGPLTGTNASTSGRWSVVTKGPLTGAIACSNSGGFFGAELKMAGWDMIIFEGKAAKPMYLHIHNEKSELLPADGLWGKTVWETETALKAKHEKDSRVASIGPAGENGVLYAGVVNDMDRAAGRSGVGTVMGSKNLKAIIVRGTKGVQVKDPRKFIAAANEGKKILAAHPVTSKGLPTYGTQVLMNLINETGAMPTHNGRDVQFAGASKISGEAMNEAGPDGHTNLISKAACFGCTIQCARVSHINPKHWVSTEHDKRYQGRQGGVEYENAWALGSATGISDLDVVTFAHYLCNEYGMDPITHGSTVAAAMELYEIGALTEKDVGFPLKFGDGKALVKLTEMTGKGIGFGKEMGKGSKRLCEKYKHPELSMTVKGQEFPAYDPRGIQGMGLTYATSNRGACHLRSYTVNSEVLGFPEKTDPLTSKGKAGLVKDFQDATAVFDSSGLCLFTSFAWKLSDLQPQIAAGCGEEFTMEKLNEIGERIWNMERQFNMAAGLTGKDDTLPKRLLKEAAKTGPAKGKVAELDVMLPEYYELRGWSKDGVPKAETTKRLGL
ncbi:MAG: aldehyde ferredoxin oxidoreductase family protein [Deltaproteobacteria bacterium]|nr:aldehyde ferredoxin oxidoreductase family protein [Deltaproteobacteria bacterium]